MNKNKTANQAGDYELPVFNQQYCCYSGLIVSACDDFANLLSMGNIHHPVYDVSLTQISKMLSEHPHLSMKEQCLICAYPFVWLKCKFLVPLDLDQVAVHRIFNKAKTAIHRLNRVVKYNSEIQRCSKSERNILKEVIKNVPSFCISSDNHSNVSNLVSYLELVINACDSVTAHYKVKQEVSAEYRLALANEDIARALKRKEMLAKDDFKLRKQHFDFIAQELINFYRDSVTNTRFELEELSNKVQILMTAPIQEGRFTREEFIRFAGYVKQVMLDNSGVNDSLNEDVDFIIRRLESRESELNKLQGYIGAQVFSATKKAGGVSYAVVEVDTESNVEQVFNTIPATINNTKLAAAIAEAKARIARTK